MSSASSNPDVVVNTSSTDDDVVNNIKSANAGYNKLVKYITDAKKGFAVQQERMAALEHQEKIDKHEQRQKARRQKVLDARMADRAARRPTANKKST
jgi:hypothetical protein